MGASTQITNTMQQEDTVYPPVLWAQRSDRLLISIDLQDCENVVVKFTETSLTFSCNVGEKKYFVCLEFLHEINPKESTYGVLGRQTQINVVKKESGPYWDRLLKEEGKHWFLKGDWDRWVDEDEEDDDDGAGDFNLDDLNRGGDFGNYDFGSDEDEDDDLPPDLEEDLPD